MPDLSTEKIDYFNGIQRKFRGPSQMWVGGVMHKLRRSLSITSFEEYSGTNYLQLVKFLKDSYKIYLKLSTYFCRN